MSKLLTYVFSLFIVASPLVHSGEAGFLKGINKDLELREYTKNSLKDRNVKALSAFFFTVLSNTQELRIHQMNGETTNDVYIRDEGQEAVFRFERDDNGKKIDGTGTLVKDCLNMGSFNYYHPYRAPLGHFAADILPWLVWGNCKEDPSTVNQRIEAYMLDFREGYALTLKRNEGFYLPKNFNFKEAGQSETISFFEKALEKSGFDFGGYFPSNFKKPEKQKEFFSALERGMKDLLKNT